MENTDVKQEQLQTRKEQLKQLQFEMERLKIFLFSCHNAIEKSPSPTIKSVFDSAFKDLKGIKPHPTRVFLTNGLTVSYLLFILCAKDLIKDELTEMQTKKIEELEKEDWGTIKVLEGKIKNLGDVIRVMRNAISHFNFTVDEQNGYTFWNEDKKGDVIHKMHLTSDSMAMFLTKWGVFLAKSGIHK